MGKTEQNCNFWKIIRILTAAPIMATMALILLWIRTRDIFTNLPQLLLLLLCLGLLPLLAYPMQRFFPRFKDQGRNGQRHLAMIFAVGGYILSYNGGMIIDCKTKEVVRRETLPIEYYADIVRCANKFDVVSLTYDSEGIITNDENDKYVQIESRINNIPVRQVFHLDEEAQLDPPVKFLCTGEHKVLKQVQDKLNEKLNGAVTIFFSEPYFLEIMPQGIEKASSLEILLNKLGIDKKHLIACGDGYNDIPMMQYAGLSVAMANAQEETKEWADYIAPSNDEDGVAAAIEKFIF